MSGELFGVSSCTSVGKSLLDDAVLDGDGLFECRERAFAGCLRRVFASAVCEGAASICRSSASASNLEEVSTEVGVALRMDQALIDVTTRLIEGVS